MAKAPQNAISPTRAEDYPEWYQQVIKAADLGREFSGPWLHGDQALGYNCGKMQRALDDMFKRPDTKTHTFIVHPDELFWKRKQSM